LIEDEPQLRRFLRPMLHAEGYRLIEAETAAEGLRQVEVGNRTWSCSTSGCPTATAST
jgi:two-component system KDP operon response regulator KdpE